MLPDEEEELDDMTIGLQMQQFLDEWNLRALHAETALEKDHPESMVTAISLLQEHGVPISDDENIQLSRMPEEQAVALLVSRMTAANRRTFEHFVLQLQLFISAATRVRIAVEGGDPEELRKVIEDGDKATTHYILKQAVVEASVEIQEFKNVHSSWACNMTNRVDRVMRNAAGADSARAELQSINTIIDGFSTTQNHKTVNVLVALLGKVDQALVRAAFRGWRSNFVQHQAEADIHAKFRKQIAGTKEMLCKCKLDSRNNVRRVLLKVGSKSDEWLFSEVWRSWSQFTTRELESRGKQKEINICKARLAQMKDTQKKSAMSALLRIAASNDNAVLGLCWRGWSSCAEQSKKTSALLKNQAEIADLSSTMKSAGGSLARGVLERAAVFEDACLLGRCYKVWCSETQAALRRRDINEQMDAASTQMVNMKSCHKVRATNVTQSTEMLEDGNLMISVFMNWQTEVMLARVIRHYSGKMDANKSQLESVRMMFSQFASELGDIGTPRRGSGKHSRSHHHAAPPPDVPDTAQASAA